MQDFRLEYNNYIVDINVNYPCLKAEASEGIFKEKP
jgi:hypothetical protein